jgi:hydrogenase maturation factor
MKKDPGNKPWILLHVGLAGTVTSLPAKLLPNPDATPTNMKKDPGNKPWILLHVGLAGFEPTTP